MLIQEVMRTQFVTIEPHLSLRQAAVCMLEHSVNMLPVVIDDSRMVGVIGSKDILHQPLPALLHAHVGKLTNGNELAHYLDSKLVSELMHRTFWSLEAQTSVSQAATTMMGISASFAPVIHDGLLVGIVTRSDLMRAILGLSTMRG